MRSGSLGDELRAAAGGGRRGAMRFTLRYTSVSSAGVSFTPRVLASVRRR